MYLVLAPQAHAYVPILVHEESLKDIIVIDDPELSQTFYGEMTGFPHTFEIRATEPFSLFTQILVPDSKSSKDIISGIIIKETERGKRVEEITRLSLKTAWPTDYEPYGGDFYRKGPSFEKELGPGVYRIEVNTPDNLEKYVLIVGRRDERALGYFELVGRIAEVKTFFGKSKIRVVESPFVYGPLLLAVLIFGYWMYRRRKKNELP